MPDAILTVNAGSSSLKFAVFECDRPDGAASRGELDGLFSQPRFRVRDAHGHPLADHSWPPHTTLTHPQAIQFLLSWIRSGPLGQNRIVAVGHRVVHGGRIFREPVRIDDGVLQQMEALGDLAPLHQPHNLAAIRAIAEHAPELPQVACFDTAFHHTQTAIAQMFALPHRYFERGIHRYGFHGLSYEYVASVLPTLDARVAAGRTVVAHLGNGASMCALQNGQSVATTMGFTALDGLMMGTRCGSLDPGVLLYLMDHDGLSRAEVEDLVYHQSGLLGVSGLSGDMRVLLESRDPRAALAIDLFVYRIVRELGSLAAALNGLDAFVFTAGIGENAPAIRAQVCRQASWLGIELDDAANDRGGPCITTPHSRVSVWVVATDEERVIAGHTRRLTGLTNSSPAP